MVYEALATIGAALIAGVSFNTLGIWKKYRELGEKAIDWAKVKKNVIIGSVLGVIAYGVSLADKENNIIPAINDLETFVLAVIAFFPAIVIADAIFANHGKQAEDEVDFDLLDPVFSNLDDLSERITAIEDKEK